MGTDMKTIEWAAGWMDEGLWWLRTWAARLWLIARHRPFFTCPFCRGNGGAMSGYYEPEWCECSACWPRWEGLEDHGMKWFIGRMPLMDYLRAGSSIWAGLCLADS